MCDDPGFTGAVKRSHRVNPVQVQAADSSLTTVLNTLLHDMGFLGQQGQHVTYKLNFMHTKREYPQRGHVDFPLNDLSRDAMGLRTRLPFEQRVPWVVVFPTAESGMTLQVWPSASIENFSQDPVTGTLVEIPFGKGLILRGDVVHSGCFKTNDDGNPRVHLYVYQSGGIEAELTPGNVYKFPDGTPFENVFIPFDRDEV